MEPLSREFLLSRGYCCHNGCLNCPYGDFPADKSEEPATMTCEKLTFNLENTMEEFIGDIGLDRDLKLRYIRDKKRRPRGLVIVDSVTGETGWSFCCKADHFKKSTARSIAMGRLCRGTDTPEPRIVEHELEKVQAWLKEREAACDKRG